MTKAQLEKQNKSLNALFGKGYDKVAIGTGEGETPQAEVNKARAEAIKVSMDKIEVGRKQEEAGWEDVHVVTDLQRLRKLAEPNAPSKPKTNKQKAKAFVAGTSKWTPAEIKYLKALVAAL